MAAQLNVPIQQLIKKGLQWHATEVPGTEVAELELQYKNSLSQQQFVRLRKAIGQDRTVEKKLQQMRRISRQVLTHHIPGPRRRK